MMNLGNDKAKLYLLIVGAVNSLLAVWSFISIAYHTSQSIGQGGAGVGGRTGFGYVMYILINTAFWFLSTFLVFLNKFTIETYCMLLSAAAAWGVLFGWIFIFIFTGTAHQLIAVALNVITPESINTSFTNSADATTAAIVLSFIVSICFVGLMVIAKAGLLSSESALTSGSHDELPAEPTNMGYVQHTDNTQANYYNQPPPPTGVYPEQDAAGYSNYSAQGGESNGAYS